MDDDDASATAISRNAGNDRVELRVLPEFGGRKQRWKLFLAEVVQNDLVTVASVSAAALAMAWLKLPDSDGQG